MKQKPIENKKEMLNKPHELVSINEAGCEKSRTEARKIFCPRSRVDETESLIL